MNTRHKQRVDDLALPSEPVILTTVDLMSSVILSLSGSFEASAEERKLLCLLSDGRLLIASGQALNAHVQSYRARLERLNHAFTIVFCAIEVIGPLYRRGGDNTGRHHEHTVMQVTAKDLLARGCRERASDIHIRVNKLSTDFYFRIYNDLIKVGSQTRDYGERLLATIYGAMTAVSDNSYKPTERQDASIGDRDKLPDMLYGVRIATAPTSEGNLMVLRLLYNDAGDHIDLRPLGFSEAHASQIQTLKDQPIGINIISGPTGSGKSTTLQRVLSGELIESQGKIHVITVEDPVEYPIPGAVQTAVTNATTEVERSRLFSAAISNAMRLDPDTIMIGEIRDGASAQSALRAAMTGHQVWSTVHANSAIAIIDRLVDLGLPLAMTADHTIITGLISQRLVKLLCPHCRRRLATCEGELSIAQTERLHKAVGNKLAKVYLTGDGCKACGGKGTIGRTVVAEVIMPDAELCTYLRKGDKMGATEYWRTMLGGQTLVEHAIGKIADGLIDPRMAEKTVGHLVPLNQCAKPAASAKKA
ncbi:GspE/PulE family protein [Actimicrobium sp. CCI2.3]|uniref:GspE/PulE family protein n=1 Tax=Actimicrobium sp. CCI2.3 TaxID=3048616 RepID=UPI002AB4354C|nr:ATPase, T2SS/T4P/T4SS family [Actimicrobium sp. CCI2.3]MDY7573516.1 ATPase, T2SS/T4P/T4SS family [Actimicrobium sp. CCI2.3]MEB0022697.1 ATPase, T2SS/T4P/T4SS family [Actimicrobium sp. CCI2.3]